MSAISTEVARKKQASVSPQPSVIGTLPVSKTVTITFVPDWIQDNKSQAEVSMCLLFGPANTLPQDAPWYIHFNVFCSESVPIVNTNKSEESISKGQRALLWYDGKSFEKYKHSVVSNNCSSITNKDLKTHSIVLRTHGSETNANALIWARKRTKSNNYNSSHLKVVSGHHYYLNITFAAQSTIAQKVGDVGDKAWRPIIYVFSKTKDKDGVETIQSRLFTDFITNWAQGIEPNVDERELKLEKEAIQQDAKENAEYQTSLKSANDKDSALKLVPSLMPNPKPPATSRMISVGEVRYEGYMPGVDIRKSADTHTGYFTTYNSSFPMVKTNFASMASHSHTSSSMLKPTTWAELETAINTVPVANIMLPSLEDKPFKTDIPFEQVLEKFTSLKESTLAQALFAIEGTAMITAKMPNSPLVNVARPLVDCFSAVSQLKGWLEVEKYICNEKSAVVNASVNELILDGQKLLRRLAQRIDWVLELQRTANKAFDPEFCLKVIAADRTWTETANAFMKKAETDVTYMLTHNPQKFHAFRELQRKGVQWPHSPQLRKEIESAGFVFRPMMIKRDRCVCEICNEEVWGWKSWDYPLSFHNYAKHPNTFQPGVAATLWPPTSEYVKQMITASNLGTNQPQYVPPTVQPKPANKSGTSDCCVIL